MKIIYKEFASIKWSSETRHIQFAELILCKMGKQASPDLFFNQFFVKTFKRGDCHSTLDPSGRTIVSPKTMSSYTF